MKPETTPMKTPNRMMLRSVEEWAGLLSAQDFSRRDPQDALEFLLDFQGFLRNKIRKDIKSVL